jgi:tetratricopeptide (TPR) repeat protein
VEAARGDLERALTIRPEYPEATFNLGLAREKQGDAAGAIEAYRRTLALSPDFPDAHWNLGRLLSLRGEMAEGRSHLERAHDLDPSLPLERTLRILDRPPK